MNSLFNWLFDLLSNKNDNTLIGLSQLREAKITVEEVKKPKRDSKNLKLSDLMKGELY